MCLPDVRHRMLLHNSFGCFLVEKVFGHTLTNSEGKVVCTRDVAEDHIQHDLGFIPTVERCFSGMKIEPWMGGKVSKYAAESAPQPAEHTVTIPYPPVIETMGFTDTTLIPRNDLSSIHVDGTRPILTGEKKHD